MGNGGAGSGGMFAERGLPKSNKCKQGGGMGGGPNIGHFVRTQ